MAKAAKEKTEFTVAPQNDSAKGSWHTATAGMYTKEGLAELRNSQAFTPKPSGGRSRERLTRGGGGGDAGTAAAGSEQVFAGDEAEMVHEAGQQGDLKEVRYKGKTEIRGVRNGDLVKRSLIVGDSCIRNLAGTAAAAVAIRSINRVVRRSMSDRIGVAGAGGVVPYDGVFVF